MSIGTDTAPRELTDWPGTENNPRVSPDGTTLAFEAVVDGTQTIFLMDLATSAVHRFAAAVDGDRRPAWSPDGQLIAFISDRGGTTGLWVAPVDGGTATRLFDGADHLLTAPDWSPDGTRIAMSWNDPNGIGDVSWGRSTVISIDASDGTATELTDGGDEWWPRWSADGEWLYYYIGLTDDLEAVNATSREIRAVGPGGLIGWRPAASPDGEHVTFVSDIAGFGLWIGSLTRSTVPTAVVRSGEPDAPSFAPDGSTVVFSRDTTSTLIVALDLADLRRDTLVVGRSPQPLGTGVAYLPDGPRRNMILVHREARTDTLTLSMDFITGFAFSPDESRLVVAAPGAMDARHDLHLFDSAGTHLRKLTDAGDVWRGFHWCDDGRTLVYATSGDKVANAFRELWSLDAVTGETTRVTAAAGGSIEPNHCDQDAGRITFQGRARLSGLWVYERNSHSRAVKLNRTGFSSRWSPDGTRLVFVDVRDGRTDIFIIEPDGSETRVTDDPAIEMEPGWSADGTRLYFGVRSPNRGIWVAPVATN